MKETLMKALPRQGGERESQGKSPFEAEGFDADWIKSAFP